MKRAKPQGHYAPFSALFQFYPLINLECMKPLIKILAVALIVSFFPACESNLELEPYTALDASTGFKTKSDIEAALLGAYNAVQSSNYYGLQMQVLPDLYSDILSHTGTFPTYAQVFNRQILADNSNIQGTWNTLYVAINRANNVIASAPGIQDASFNAANTVGEARLLRAYHYFNLLILFGGSPAGFNQSGGLGVPIFTEPTLSADDAAPKARSTEAEVWTQIMSDMDFAVANLSASNGNGRANKNVALALKARMHLYRNEWAQAEAAASEVIASGKYTMMTTQTYPNIWLSQNSSEAIWELQFDINNTNSIAFWYLPTSSGGRNEFTSTASLKSAHEPGDARLAVNVTTAPANKTLKYTRVNGTDNVILLRLAEMYLIRAEARARQNNLSGAVADLNVVRKRAGIAEVALDNANAIVDAVMQERRVELAHEGHRWFDLRRIGKWNATGLTEDFRSRWPIPQREVQTAGTIMVQNPGY